MLQSKGCSEEKLVAAKERAKKIEELAKYDAARKKYQSLSKLADSKVITYYGIKEEFEKAPTEDNSKLLTKTYEEAKEAVAKKEEALKVFNELKKEG